MQSKEMNTVHQLLTQHLDIWTAAETEKKSGRGRASGNTGSVYGIKKLRELILELAVRGKLVPQDPNDEPASELLKRIQAEKAKLIAEGKLKKEKPLAPISEGEKPFELPHGWEWVSLSEVADVIRGVTYGKSDASELPLDGYVPLLRGNNIDRVLNFEKPVYVPKKLLNETQFVKKGDIVIAMSSGSADLVGKAAQAETDFNGGFGAFCGVVRSFSTELFSYFCCFFQTPYYRNVVAGYGKGIGINNLQKSSLVLLNLPIPPFAEQHRIVAKVDELMALCDQLENQHLNAAEAHETLVSELLATLTQSQNAADFNANWQRIYAHFEVLFTSEASIDALKQTLLQLAVMGKLVPQDPNDEPASDLYKRIKVIKDSLIKQKIYQKTGALNEKISDVKYPKGWLSIQIGEICPSIVPSRDKPKSFSGEIPWVTLPAFPGHNLYLDTTKIDIRLSDEEIKSSKVRVVPKGSLLMSCIGRFGLTAINLESVVPNQQIHAFVIIDGISAEFLSIVIRSSEKKLNSIATSTTVAYLNKSNCESLEFGLPPSNEQHRIVDKVDELMALCDQLKTRIQQASQQQQLIADALVTQEVA